MTSFNLNYILKALISKYSHIRSWGFNIGILRGHNLVYTLKKERSAVTYDNINEFENTMFNEWSQTQKNSYCVSPFPWNIYNRQMHRNRKHTSGC